MEVLLGIVALLLPAAAVYWLARPRERREERADARDEAEYLLALQAREIKLLDRQLADCRDEVERWRLSNR